METEWMMARMRLYQLQQEHPEWSDKRLAETLGYSERWVRKWNKRFREVSTSHWQMFCCQSHAPKQPANKTEQPVKEAILTLRDDLKATYHRQVGPKLILYHLHRDEQLKKHGYRLPTSTHTIWRILKEAGRIPDIIRNHQPIERPAPLEEWEFDFGVSTSLVEAGLEFFTVVDRGTSILLNTQVKNRYHADTALSALAQALLVLGCPERLRFDRDSRFVGSWTTDGFPSALVRFLRCLGIEPVVCPPRRPDLKPFVERAIRTLKHECLFVHQPNTLEQVREVLETFTHFYNAERPNQALSCNNQPPYSAYPRLPALRRLPETVDPDRWLLDYHGRIFRRTVQANGTVQVDKHLYSIGTDYAGQRVNLHLNAHHKVFHVIQKGKLIRQVEIKGLHGTSMPFDAYLTLMLEEARSIEQHLLLKGKITYG